MRSALGTQFTDTDELFLEHRLLVNSAENIAHLALGLDAEQLTATTLLSGDRCTIAGLYGVVDRDFLTGFSRSPAAMGLLALSPVDLPDSTGLQWSTTSLKVLYDPSYQRRPAKY